MQTELSVVIDRPIEEVFEVTNDHVTEWSLTCVEEEVLDEKPDGVGTTFRIVTEERGRRMEFQGVVTRWNPPVAAAVHLVGAHFDVQVLYAFEDLSQQDGSARTRVTQYSEIQGKRLMRPALFLFGWAMKRTGCRAQEAELASLKRTCEERAAAASA